MGCPIKCKQCNGDGFQRDKLNWEITGKCKQCSGLGWVDECPANDKNKEAKNIKCSICNDIGEILSSDGWIICSCQSYVD